MSAVCLRLALLGISCYSGGAWREGAPLNRRKATKWIFFVPGVERWPSGLRHALAKRASGKLLRGFESLSLR